MLIKIARLSIHIFRSFWLQPDIQVSKDGFRVSQSRRAQQDIQFQDLTNFPIVQDTWLIRTITFQTADRLYQVIIPRTSKLFSVNSDELIGVKRVARFFDDMLHYQKTQFDLLAHNQYLRDSSVTKLDQLITPIANSFIPNKKMWEKHLTNQSIDWLKFVAGLLPLASNVHFIRENYENRILAQRASFYDSVESNPLTDEQRLGVIRSNDRNMVLAAAGTGKTSVMVAKALDIIDRGLANSEEILILAYNRSAALELQERLSDKAKKINLDLESSPNISTFHALGRKIIQEAGMRTYMSVFTEDEKKLEQWITKWVTDFVKDSSRLFRLMSLTPEPVNPFDFRTKAEYEAYIRDNEFRTLKGDVVKGYQELLIANFMYLNGVEYEYEAPYVSKTRVDIGYDYRPDFHLTDTDIYIEHFGIDRNGNTRPGIDKQAYNEGIEKKRALHAEKGTRLLETFHYEWMEENLEASLARQLKECGIQLTPIPTDEILKKLQESGVIAHWVSLFKKALQAIRVERLDQSGIEQRLKEAKISRNKRWAELLAELQSAYIDELVKENAIDFDDMIIRATQAINEGSVVPKWKYVLIDEFQDISAARMELVNSIVDKGPSPSLTVVGDDWQSIYRFSGGKLELTTRFDQMVGSYTLTKLQKTFRYNNSIALTAGEFIMRNPEQYQKSIVTHDRVDEPQVYLLDDKSEIDDGVYLRTAEIVAKIRSVDPKGSIAVIARYNYLLNDSKLHLGSLNLKDGVKFWSFHKSKGLESDYCILIGFFQGKTGFPNENKDDAIVEALLPTLDSFPHSEERRLLYVGITRAKKKSYIVANPSAPSAFVQELLSPRYELNIASKKFQEQYQQIFKCPNCSEGYLKLIRGKFGEFYSCSTGLGCKARKARVCTKCRSPQVDFEKASICNNPNCRDELPICNKCGRPMKLRESKYGKFWGCTGYGIKDDQCTHTRKYFLSI